MIIPDNCFFCGEEQYCNEVEATTTYGNKNAKNNINICFKCEASCDKKETSPHEKIKELHEEFQDKEKVPKRGPKKRESGKKYCKQCGGLEFEDKKAYQKHWQVVHKNKKTTKKPEKEEVSENPFKNKSKKCIDCETDITGTDGRITRCKKCQKEFNEKRNREASKKAYGFRTEEEKQADKEKLEKDNNQMEKWKKERDGEKKIYKCTYCFDKEVEKGEDLCDECKEKTKTG